MTLGVQIVREILLRIGQCYLKYSREREATPSKFSLTAVFLGCTPEMELKMQGPIIERCRIHRESICFKACPCTIAEGNSPFFYGNCNTVSQFGFRITPINSSFTVPSARANLGKGPILFPIPGVELKALY